MRRLVLLFFFLLGMASCGAALPAFADPPPVSGGQPRPDLFESGVVAHPSLDYYRPIHSTIEQTGIVFYRYTVEPGCSDQSTVGYHSIGYNLGTALGDEYNNTNLVHIYVNGTNITPDYTIHINCGTSATAVGIGNGVIGCLCRGYGGSSVTANDVDLLQDMRDYYDLSQASIILHEVAGHDDATFNEEYCAGYDANLGCTGLFAAVPNWIDFMNTGPDSRHLFSYNELARWGRVHGTPAPQSAGVDPAGFYWACGVSSKALGVWIEGVGSVLKSDLKLVNGCYGVNLVGYMTRGTPFTVTWGNMVDWKSPLFRSDRVYTWN